MKIITVPALIALTLIVTGCEAPAPEAYRTSGKLESMIEAPHESITFTLQNSADVDEMDRWLKKNGKPVNALLDCSDAQDSCRQAAALLEKKSIPYRYEYKGGQTAQLWYGQLRARACDPSYVDRTSNPYRLNHPSFGCSVRSNLVQMVANPKVFVNPSLLDPGDAEKAQQVIRQGYQPKSESKDAKSVTSDVGN